MKSSIGMVTAICIALVASLLVLRPQSAQAAFATLASGFTQSDYLTDFPNNGPFTSGPTGIVFAANGNILVIDSNYDNLYSFPPTGGAAGTPLANIGGRPLGLTFGHDGALYVARQSGDVEQIDPTTGGYIRTVASGLGVATGLATDPLSGDLFVSTQSANIYSSAPAILRIHPQDGSVVPYTAVGALSVPDGLTFDTSGILYVSDNDTGNIVRVDRTGASTVLTTLPGGPDGIAIGAAGSPLAGSLFVNRNDGELDRIDLTQSPPAVSVFASGGSRGDLVAVSPDGYLFATQTDRVVRIAPPDFCCGATATPTSTATATSTPTSSPTPTNSATPANTATATNTPQATATNTAVGATATHTPTATSTPPPATTQTVVPTATNTPPPVVIVIPNTPVPSPTAVLTPTAVSTPTPVVAVLPAVVTPYGGGGAGLRAPNTGSGGDLGGPRSARVDWLAVVLLGAAGLGLSALALALRRRV